MLIWNLSEFLFSHCCFLFLSTAVVTSSVLLFGLFFIVSVEQKDSNCFMTGTQLKKNSFPSFSFFVGFFCFPFPSFLSPPTPTAASFPSFLPSFQQSSVKADMCCSFSLSNDSNDLSVCRCRTGGRIQRSKNTTRCVFYPPVSDFTWLHTIRRRWWLSFTFGWTAPLMSSELDAVSFSQSEWRWDVRDLQPPCCAH